MVTVARSGRHVQVWIVVGIAATLAVPSTFVGGEHGDPVAGAAPFALYTANGPTDAPFNPLHLTALLVDGVPTRRGTGGDRTGSFDSLVITTADPAKFVVSFGGGVAAGQGETVRVEGFAGRYSWSNLNGGTTIGNIKLDGTALYVSVRDAAGFSFRGEDANANAVNDFVEDGDGDRLTDGAERHDHGTMPNDADSDDDGYDDGAEVLDLGSDPNDPDDPTPRDAPPTAPRDLAATRGPGPGQIALAWQPPASEGGSPVVRYDVYRTVDGAESFAFEATETSALDEGLAPGTFHAYRVRAVNAFGAGPFSESAGATTFALPSAPQALQARSGPARGDVSLQWEPPADTDGRDLVRTWIHRGASAGHLEPYDFVGPAATSYLDDGNADGATFYYTVHAETDVGVGPGSNEAHATTYTNEPQVEANLPQGVSESSAVWQGHYAYVFGGLSGPAGEQASLDKVFRFDPSTGEAIELPDRLPTPRHGTSAVWTGHDDGADGNMIQSCHPSCAAGLGYLFGGDVVSTPTGDGADGGDGATPASCHPSCLGGAILEYDPAAGTFTQQSAQIDPPRTATAAVWVPLASADSMVQSCHPSCVAGYAYIVGGHAQGTLIESCHPSCVAGTEVLRYDPVNDVLQSTNGVLPTPRGAPSAVFVPDDGSGSGEASGGDGGLIQSCHPSCAVGGVYIFGGEAAGLVSSEGPGREILRYDIATDSVVTLPATLPSPRAGTSAFYDGRFAYVLGGIAPDGTRLDEIVRFDPTTNEVLVVGHLPTERSGTSAAFDGRSAHIVGGDDGDATLDDIVRFTPGAPQNVAATSGPGAGEATVTWTPPTTEGLAPVSGYRVYVGTASNAETLRAELGPEARTYTATGFGGAAVVYFKVSAVSSVGEGPQSRESSAATFDVPTEPRDLSVLFPPEPGVVTLLWSPPLSDGGTPLLTYEVWRAIDSATGPGELGPIGSVTADQTSFEDRTCSVPEFCRYAVLATNLVGPGPLSDQVTGVGTSVPSK